MVCPSSSRRSYTWWTAVLTFLTAAALPGGCAGASGGKVVTPLPPVVHVAKPPADIPESVAAFSGVWAGRYREWVSRLGAFASGVDHALVVESIGRSGAETYRASVIYSWGAEPGGSPPGFFWTSGVIGSDGVLSLQRFTNGAQVTYKMSPDRNVLSVEYDGRGFRSFGQLSRAQQEPQK